MAAKPAVTAGKAYRLVVNHYSPVALEVIRWSREHGSPDIRTAVARLAQKIRSRR